jgi:hypothetical protein
VLSLLLMMCRFASAEDGYGNISGTIFEAGGKPAPLATVTMVHQGGDFHRILVADQDGKYQASRLPAGSYEAVAGSVRTGASSRLTVIVASGQSVELRIDLSTPAVAVLSENLREIPLNGRDYLDLVRNASEVTRGQEGGNIEGYTPFSPRGNSSVNLAGQRGQNNNFLLDGMDNNENWLGAALLQHSLESIESVSLYEGYIPASLGHATGGAVIVESRSGSNRFHGSAFEYFQNSALNARNFFDGGDKPGLTQNQFGGSLGGPIRKNDWFFFVDTDVTRERRGLTVISTVPTAAQKGGDFGSIPIFDPTSTNQLNPSVFSRNPFPENRIPLGTSKQGAALAALYPDPNLPGIVNNYRYAPALIQNRQQVDAHTEKNFSSRSRLSALFSYESQDGLSPNALPGSFASSDSVQHADGANTNLTAWSVGLAHTFVIKPSLVNEYRASLTRFEINAQPLDTGLNASALGIPGVGAGVGAGGLPLISPSGYAHLGAANAAPLHIRDSNDQVADNVLWTTRRHSFRFGFQLIRRQTDGTASEYSSRGTFSFTPDYTDLPGTASTGNSIASLLTGLPAEVRRDVQLAPYSLRGWEWAGFAQDDIRLSRTLTVQVGVRYSFDPPLSEASNRLVNYDFNVGKPFAKFAGQGVNQYGDLHYDHRTFAPRIGLAWDVSGKGSTVVRAGFSKIYDPGTYFATGMLARNEPFASRLDILNSVFQAGSNLADGLPAPTALTTLDMTTLNSAHVPVYLIESPSYSPNTDQWRLSVQQRLKRGFALEAALLSSMGIHLLGEFDSNQATLQSFCNCFRRQFDPFVQRVEFLNFAAGSTYYGGELKLTGNMVSGLQLQVVYRYAKAIDDSTQPFTDQQSRPADAENIYYHRGVRSPSPFDITHRLVVTATYDLPFKSSRSKLVGAALGNWRVLTVITAQTGLPFTPQLAINGLNSGGVQLPNRLSDGSLPSDQRTYLHWFNTSLDPADPNRAFAMPGNFQYGNSGFDILRGPGLVNVDASLARTFSLSDRLRLQTRVEAFNFLNRTNFGLPERLLGLPSSGAIDHTATFSRQIQVVARVEW